jgi:putative pyruvate formate lyase activating enzyme
MLDLQRHGAININLVTPTHVVPHILEALGEAVASGLNLPLVYNCSGYERVETLRMLDGIVDIYMPDIKFYHPEPAASYCRAGDYPQRARAAVKEMHRQVGDLILDHDGTAVRGLLVRHLLMPDRLAGTPDWLRFVAREISKDTYINIMDQYRPCGQAWSYPELCGPIPAQAREEAVVHARNLGLTRIDPGSKPRLQDIFKL